LYLPPCIHAHIEWGLHAKDMIGGLHVHKCA
jgi:hypothetical protein